MKSKILSTLIPVLLVCSFIYFMGFRLDGLTAARANSFVPKDSILQDQVDYKWGTVYIFDSPEKPMTAISMKKLGFLWISDTSVYFLRNEDPIRTIGGVSLANVKEKATVFSVIVEDPEVAYIEAGTESHREQKQVILGEPITFSWDVPIHWNDLNPKALNGEGEVIYEYRYAKSNIIRLEDLKWYPV